jgi:hypothetical protein
VGRDAAVGEPGTIFSAQHALVERVEVWDACFYAVRRIKQKCDVFQLVAGQGRCPVPLYGDALYGGAVLPRTIIGGQLQ